MIWGPRSAHPPLPVAYAQVPKKRKLETHALGFDSLFLDENYAFTSRKKVFAVSTVSKKVFESRPSRPKISGSLCYITKKVIDFTQFGTPNPLIGSHDLNSKIGIHELEF